MSIGMRSGCAALVLCGSMLTAIGSEPGGELTMTEVAEAKQLLGALGYWVEPLATEREESWRQAVIAFRKATGGRRNGRLTRRDLDLLRSGKSPQPLESGAPHIEIDLHRQLLLFVDADGQAIRIISISSGSGKCFTEGGRTRRAITPVGRFTITRKIRGWRQSPLGKLYYPSYFVGGAAIHGNPSVPAFPTSHGCVRVPMFAAEELFLLAPIGMRVIVYDSNPQPAARPGRC